MAQWCSRLIFLYGEIYMELILWRHGDAFPKENGTDHERKLTPLGETQAKNMAALLKAKLPKDVQIYCSPAVRCQQTIKALDMPFVTSPKLDTNASVLDLLQLVDWDSDSLSKTTTLICSHQPTLGQTVSNILTNQSQYWPFKKGSIWWLSSRQKGHDSHAWVKLVLTPDIVSD